MDVELRRDKSWIVAWLFAGMVMVFVQILLGGITRLTGSGLSITRWEIVTGVIPPLNEQDWQEAFDLYKNSPQYQKINKGINLQYFKYIFFWEYIHRLWARMMGVVFIIPFLIFCFRGSIHTSLLKRLSIVVGIASLAAIFGWIMVASGLIERPWVNAYKLTLHLGLGIWLFIYLTYTWFHERGIRYFQVSANWKKYLLWLIILTMVQVCFGGFVSGMKSALSYPTWPLMNGMWIPEVVFESKYWTTDSFLLYDQSGFMPTLVQVIHRNLAYIITVLIAIFAWKWIKSKKTKPKWIAYSLTGLILVQVLLGILTLLHSRGSIPVSYGVLHQGVGILFLTHLVITYLQMKTI